MSETMTAEQAASKLMNIMNDDIYSWSPELLTAFGMAVDALRMQSKEVRALASVLDGSPLMYPCDTLGAAWCKEHCDWQEPAAECWIKYAEVMASE